MTDVHLIDPPVGPAWCPFGHCRPIAELRAGAWLIRERWEAVAGGETKSIAAAPHLLAFAEDGVPPVVTPGPVTGPAVVGRSDFAPSGEPVALPDAPARLVNDGETVGWCVPAGTTWTPDATYPDAVAIDGMVLHGAYDLVTALEHLLVADAADFTHERGDEIPDASVVIGDPTDVVLLGALVEPGVTFDVREGAVVIEQHAYVKGGTRFEGPVYVGPGTAVQGGLIRHCSIGPRCRIRGDVQTAVFLGYGNKVHDGFVGHSVVGRWVNLGAGTTTSDLKNTYGPVRLAVAGERIETGRQFLGTLFGDYAKTAIGTLLDTGSVVGAGANIFGAVRPPKYVPPFAWGDGRARVERDGFLTVVNRTLPRRDVQVTDAVRASLCAIYDHAVAE